MTRDNMLEGDSGASGLGRQLRQTSNPPAPLRIRIPAHTAANFEGLVVRVDEIGRARRAAGIAGSWFAASMTRRPGPSLGCVHLAANGLGGESVPHQPAG